MADAPYTGVDILTALTGAKNYNTFLADEVEKALAGAGGMVDFGAGIGTFAGLLKERGHEVECVEPDAELGAGLAREGFAVRASILDYPSNSVPAVFTLNVLEHIENDEEVIASIFDRLRPGGRFYVYVPANEYLWTSLDDKVCHYRRYDRPGLRAKLTKAGFVDLRSGYVDCLGVPGTLLYRWIGSREGELTPRSIRFYDRWVFPPSRLLDVLLRGCVGKNVYAVGRKPA